MKTTMKKTALLILAAAMIVMGSQIPTIAANKPTQVDILYMNHGPLRPTIAKIKTLLTNFNGTIQATWFDVNQQEGKEFMKKHNLHGHIPLLIMLDGQTDFTVEGRNVRLQGFPSGAGPFKQVEGNWSLDDLRILFERQAAQLQAR
jgi:hypothetical protein